MLEDEHEYPTLFEEHFSLPGTANGGTVVSPLRIMAPIVLAREVLRAKARRVLWLIRARARCEYNVDSSNVTSDQVFNSTLWGK